VPGRFFTSFDEAWSFFLDREEPLEDFFAQFPEDDSYLLGWLIRFDESLVAAVREVQDAFSHLDWIVRPPERFLHTWLAGVVLAPRSPSKDEIANAAERAARAWASEPSFDVTYRGINCFHTGVVVEVVGDGPRSLVERLNDSGQQGIRIETFLPHLTIGALRGANDPAPLREVLVPLHDFGLGAQTVTEATLCVVPASQATILRSWDFVGSVALSQAQRLR